MGKQDNPQVFALLGYTQSPRINVELTIDKPQLRVGEEQVFVLKLTSKAKQPQKLLIDYAIHFMKANGQYSAKVFKLKKLELSAGESLQLKKSHPFVPLSTRRYYAGEHRIEIKINGHSFAETAFMLDL